LKLPFLGTSNWISAWTRNARVPILRYPGGVVFLDPGMEHLHVKMLLGGGAAESRSKQEPAPGDRWCGRDMCLLEEKRKKRLFKHRCPEMIHRSWDGCLARGTTTGDFPQGHIETLVERRTVGWEESWAFNRACNGSTQRHIKAHFTWRAVRGDGCLA
jgi:hypothetical protein